MTATATQDRLTVWEHLVANDGRYDQLLLVVDEVDHPEVDAIAEDLLEQFEKVMGLAHREYDEILYAFEVAPHIEEYTPTQFAEAAALSTYPGLTLALEDGNDIERAVWNLVRPTDEENAS